MYLLGRNLEHEYAGFVKGGGAVPNSVELGRVACRKTTSATYLLRELGDMFPKEIFFKWCNLVNFLIRFNV